MVVGRTAPPWSIWATKEGAYITGKYHNGNDTVIARLMCDEPDARTMMLAPETLRAMIDLYALSKHVVGLMSVEDAQRWETLNERVQDIVSRADDWYLLRRADDGKG